MHEGKSTQESDEPQNVHLVEVFDEECNLELETTGAELEVINVDDLIVESVEFDPIEVDTETVENDQQPAYGEPTYLNELIVSDLTAQVAEDHEPNYTQCCGCIQHFSCHEKLQEHSKVCHLADKAICGPVPENLIECSICYKMFSGVSYVDAMHRINAFKNRIVSVGFPEVVQCCSCDFKTTKREEMLQHSKHHADKRAGHDPSKPFECQFCFKRYKEKQSLSFHQKFSYSYKKQLIAKRRGCRALKKRTSIESQTSSRKCCGCSAEFRSLDSLKQHSRMHHELYRSKADADQFECEICFKKFPTLIRLEQHRLVPYMRKYKCDNCDKLFLTSNLLEKHMRYHKALKKNPSVQVCYEKSAQCEECGKTFKNRFCLKSHQDSCHSHEKPFSCSLCSKAFKRKHTLQNHLRVHTKEQPYSCSYCPRTFTQLTDKNRHETTIHKLEFPLRCSMCSKGFPAGRRQQLERHEELHQHGEEYPLACQFCDRTFTRLDQRNRHQARHVAEREKVVNSV
ncbi:zinc finger protein 808-like isoform X2 [Sabethes cyaneus]|nr:zinc finger protein 808-like isoform X2 [Sabethes cyaneus]